MPPHGVTFEVKADRLRVEVSVLLNLQARVLEDGDVVSPGRVGHVDRGPRAAEPREQLSHDAASPSTRQGLHQKEQQEHDMTQKAPKGVERG